MDLDFPAFLERLNSQSRSEREIADIIYEEIRNAENQKMGFLDEVERHPQYVVEVSDKIDTYVYQLQELEKKLLLINLPLDQQTALSDEEVRRRIGEQIETLKKLNNGNLPAVG